MASIVGVLQGLSSHNLPAQHAHHGHQNIQHMGAACNQPSARHAQQSRSVPPPADHQPRCSFASKPSQEYLIERDSIQRDESRRLLSEQTDCVDVQMPNVEQRIRGGTGGLKSPEDYENDLDGFMSEIVKEEDLFQKERSRIEEPGRKYSVPPDFLPQNFKENIFDGDNFEEKKSLLLRVEPDLHLIDLSQRNDAGEPYNRINLNLKEQKDFDYALGVLETFVKKLLSNGRIQMGREMAGNARRIGLFKTTFNPISGQSSRGLPPRTLVDVCDIFKSVAFYRLSGENQLLAAKMLYSCMWCVAKHPVGWIQRAVDITLVNYPGVATSDMRAIYEHSGESGSAKSHCLRTFMEGLVKNEKEAMNINLINFCGVYLSAVNKTKKGFGAPLPFVIVNDELCQYVPG